MFNMEKPYRNKIIIIICDWLSVVLWCDDSRVENVWPLLMLITIHSQHIFLCFDARHKLRIRGLFVCWLVGWLLNVPATD